MYLVTMEKQKGVTLSGLLGWSAILVILAVLGMKVVPVYLENATIEKVLTSLADDQSLRNAPPSKIRQSFGKKASIDNITAIRGSDIEISKVRGQLILKSDYSVTVPLFANISLIMDFNTSSGD